MKWSHYYNIICILWPGIMDVSYGICPSYICHQYYIILTWVYGVFFDLTFPFKMPEIMLPVIGNQHPVRQRQYNTHRRRFSCPQQPIMVSSLLPMHYRLLKTVCIMPYAIWHEIPPSPTRWIQNCMHYAVLCSNRWCIMTFVTVPRLVAEQV